jgi:hypothetical protein
MATGHEPVHVRARLLMSVVDGQESRECRNRDSTFMLIRSIRQLKTTHSLVVVDKETSAASLLLSVCLLNMVCFCCHGCCR